MRPCERGDEVTRQSIAPGIVAVCFSGVARDVGAVRGDGPPRGSLEKWYAPRHFFRDSKAGTEKPRDRYDRQ